MRKGKREAVVVRVHACHMSTICVCGELMVNRDIYSIVSSCGNHDDVTVGEAVCLNAL